MEDLSRYHEIIKAPRSALEWIAGTFYGQIQRIPSFVPSHPAAQSDALVRMIQTGDATAVVAVPRGHPDDFSGWAVGLRGALVFAYVRRVLRRHGIGAELMGSVTPADSSAIHCAYWTTDAEGMCRHGMPLVYDIFAYQALLAFVRGPGRSRTKAAVAA